MTFKKFIEEYFPWFTIDTDNEVLIIALGAWANRDEKLFTQSMPSSWKLSYERIMGKPHDNFKFLQEKIFIEKGILLFGTVGSGKTEILILLKKYCEWLQSPARYEIFNVPELGEAFSQAGFSSLNRIKSGNIFFDELCKTEQTSGYPECERVGYMSSKTVIGEYIISVRNDLFNQRGSVTLFTTNVPLKGLSDIYGERAFSRITQMCNLIPYIGTDRRLNQKPFIKKSFTIAPKEIKRTDDTEKNYKEYFLSAKDSIEELQNAYLLNDSTPISVMDYFHYERMNYDFTKKENYAAEYEIQKRQRYEFLKDNKPTDLADRNRRKEFLNAVDAGGDIPLEDKTFLNWRTKVELVKKHLATWKQAQGGVATPGG